MWKAKTLCSVICFLKYAFLFSCFVYGSINFWMIKMFGLVRANISSFPQHLRKYVLQRTHT